MKKLISKIKNFRKAREKAKVYVSFVRRAINLFKYGALDFGGLFYTDRGSSFVTYYTDHKTRIKMKAIVVNEDIYKRQDFVRVHIKKRDILKIGLLKRLMFKFNTKNESYFLYLFISTPGKSWYLVLIEENSAEVEVVELGKVGAWKAQESFNGMIKKILHEVEKGS